MRIASIDSLRVLAIFAVICIHSHPFSEWVWLINLSASFAVPYFFIVSGYFFSKKLQSTSLVGKLIVRYTKRLILVLLAWVLIYLLVPFVPMSTLFENGILSGLYWNVYDKMIWIFDHPMIFLFRGGLPGKGGHLWFVISLIMALSILSLLAIWNQQNKIFLIAIPLYVFSLLAGAYATTPVGIQVEFQSYEGPFVSTLFIAIGWWLAQSDYKPTLMLAWLAIIGGLLCITVEVSILNYFFDIPFNQPYLIGTVFFGTGFMFLALAKPDLGQNTPFPYWGNFTLGVYVSHMLVLYFLFQVIYKLKMYLSDSLWQLIYPVSLSVGLYLLSLVLTMLLAKISYIRRIVI
jgi:surface polysaccharide O-acyltransferase-like enzyme